LLVFIISPLNKRANFILSYYMTVLRLSLLGLMIFCLDAAAQNSDTLKKDTTRQLQPVTIKAYLSEQPRLRAPASVSVIGSAQLQLQPNASLVTVMNTVPGVRMEERSPGSYRLSIRGSLLRSPFGIRDVKVYYDEIPLTDAGGNTYLNAIDVSSVRNIEVLKGPDGSLFGANSGGVVRISPVDKYADTNRANLGLNAGSYGLINENGGVQNRWNNYQLNIDQAYQSYDGYRDNSYMQRHFIQTANQWRYGLNNNLKALAFYSDLKYQTPGGLTLAQAEANPRSSRLPTATLPGARQQKIGISTKTLLGGLVNEWQISSRIRNVSSIFGSHVDFANPFITNYEQRDESTYGLRSYFELSGSKQNNLEWKINAGLEWQQTNSQINNYDNQQGTKGAPQAFDNIHTNQHFFFARYTANVYQRLYFEAALSLNYYNYQFKNVYPLNQSDFNTRSFKPQLMPRVALSYQITPNFIWRASVSRGYSTPTIAEVRPTNNIVNTGLQAQTAWNYETGLRLRNKDESTFLDASIFYYRLQNAIVRRLNPDETEYYLNAGGTNQPGLELYFSSWIIAKKTTGFVRGLQVNESLTLSRFKFRDYNVAAASYANNRVTGVPNEVFITSLQLQIPHRMYVFIQHNYTSSIPLNDANTAYARRYHLLQAKAGWQHQYNNARLEVYAGADNLLNQYYSLGNDLNAVGNRYYNPSPLRNYFAGINLVL
jgi:iron complex outermembrane receptor protein